MDTRGAKPQAADASGYQVLFSLTLKDHSVHDETLIP